MARTCERCGDHWKREMQEEHSVFHGHIEDMVEQIARYVVDGLAHEEGALLTLGTDALDDLDAEPDEPVFDRQAVAAGVDEVREPTSQ